MEITLTIDDEIYRRANHRAAVSHTSVDALVEKFLEDLAGKQAEREPHQEQHNLLAEQIRTAHPGFRASDNVCREELHERNAVG
jgi:hypothetical protein